MINYGLIISGRFRGYISKNNNVIIELTVKIKYQLVTISSKNQ